MKSDLDPEYYSGENHGYWLKSPDYEFSKKLIRLSWEACDQGIACWLPEHDPSNIPF